MVIEHVDHADGWVEGKHIVEKVVSPRPAIAGQIQDLFRREQLVGFSLMFVPKNPQPIHKVLLIQEKEDRIGSGDQSVFHRPPDEDVHAVVKLHSGMPDVERIRDVGHPAFGSRCWRKPPVNGRLSQGAMS